MVSVGDTESPLMAAIPMLMPATSMVQVAALIDPRLMVEIEAVAYKPGIGGVADLSAEIADGEVAGRPAAAGGLGWPA